MPFAITQQPPPAPPGDFTLAAVAGYVPQANEQAYLATLDAMRQRLLAHATADAPAAPAAPATAAQQAVRTARVDLRKKAFDTLRTDATNFASGQLPAADAATNAHVIWGRYLALREELARLLFVVREKVDANSNLATDLLITVNNSLDNAPQDKQTLYVAIEQADTIIRTVCEATERGRWRWRRQAAQARPGRGQRLRDQYVRKLGGIGRIGLEGPHTALATLALDGLRKEFVYSEAGRIKNKYLGRLGRVCGLAAALMLAGYFIVRLGWAPSSNFLTFHQPFWLVGAGAALGTWASFSIRRQTLNFDDLAILEDDLLEPLARVAFVLLLTVTISLLFWLGAVQVEIGLLKTAQFKGTTSFLIGLFCGISERTLATAVSGRAAAFVRGIGG